MAPLSQPPSRRKGRLSTSSSSTIATPGTPTVYCKTCGRHISPRADRNMDSLVYCSTACRKRKPTQFDRRIEEAFVDRLQGKGEEFVLCSVVEEQVYSEVERDAVRKMMEEEDDDDDGDGKADKEEVAGDREQGGVEIDEDESARIGLWRENQQQKNEQGQEQEETQVERERSNHEKSLEGMERARRRERVKQAARRVVVFKAGYRCRSKNGKELDVSHAHGDWGVARY